MVWRRLIDLQIWKTGSSATQFFTLQFVTHHPDWERRRSSMGYFSNSYFCKFFELEYCLRTFLWVEDFVTHTNTIFSSTKLYLGARRKEVRLDSREKIGDDEEGDYTLGEKENGWKWLRGETEGSRSVGAED